MRAAAISNLIAVVDDYLSGLAGSGAAAVRARLHEVWPGPLQPLPPRRSAVVDQHLDAALAAVRAGGHAPLADTIAAAAPHLTWITYDSYPREGIGDFAERHAYVSLVGEDAPRAAVDYDLGLFVIAPHTLYRDHRHAAPELYVPLTGPHGWRFDTAAEFHELPAHHPVWNEPWQVHATRTGVVPFLCIFGWTKDVRIPAEICA